MVESRVEEEPKVARGQIGAFIDGFLAAKVYRQPRVPPSVYEAEERAEWLTGYDA